MPLILDPASWDETRLKEMLVSLREDLDGTLAMLRSDRAASMDPASQRTAVDLVNDVLALVDETAVPDADRARLIAVVNVEYDAMLAAIDLFKSHANVPKVPQARA